MNHKLYPVVAIFIAVVYEHIARLNGLWRFAVFLTWLAERTMDFWYACGRMWSKLSSFLNYIDFEEMMQTLDSLFRPLWHIFVSPYEFVLGYWETAKEYAHPTWVFWGSIVLLVVAYGLWYRLRGHPQWIVRLRKGCNHNRYFLGQVELPVEGVEEIIPGRSRRRT
jgi:hypothetical protein